MAVGDIYQITFFQRLLTQEMVNVFHYLQTVPNAAGIPAVDLALGFSLAIAEKYEDVLSGSWRGVGTQTVNISDLSDFDERTYVVELAGNRAGESLAPALCWSMRYNRATPGQRAGAKRVSGLSETDVNVQTPTAAMVTLLDAFGAFLSSTIIFDSGEWEPAVVKRPITLGFPVLGFYLTPSVTFAGVGTQVSRKAPFGTA